jgi:hypothetical protein
MSAPAHHQRPGIAVVSECVDVPSDRTAQDPLQRRLVEPRNVRNRGEGSLAEPSGRDDADAPEPLDRKSVQERELGVHRYDQEAVGLCYAARDLRQELRTRHADRDGDPDALADVDAKARGDVRRRACDPSQAADVQERLVDGQPFDERRGVAEDLEHRRAGLGVRLHPRRYHYRLRAQAPRLPLAHRGVDAVGFRLVAGGQHHTATHDHRATAEPRIVALLDRRVEGVGVCVQNRRLVGHRRILAPGADTLPGSPGHSLLPRPVG